jgi:BirA family biotin operon repressor/biotin-[acetyl-CoA-carboxylase] ligase
MQVWPRLTTIAALALAETIEAVSSVQAQIKWPNDVLCGEKKVAGILQDKARIVFLVPKR